MLSCKHDGRLSREAEPPPDDECCRNSYRANSLVLVELSGARLSLAEELEENAHKEIYIQELSQHQAKACHQAGFVYWHVQVNLDDFFQDQAAWADDPGSSEQRQLEGWKALRIHTREGRKHFGLCAPRCCGDDAARVVRFGYSRFHFLILGEMGLPPEEAAVASLPMFPDYIRLKPSLNLETMQGLLEVAVDDGAWEQVPPHALQEFSSYLSPSACIHDLQVSRDLYLKHSSPLNRRIFSSSADARDCYRHGLRYLQVQVRQWCEMEPSAREQVLTGLQVLGPDDWIAEGAPLRLCVPQHCGSAAVRIFVVMDHFVHHHMVWENDWGANRLLKGVGRHRSFWSSQENFEIQELSEWREIGFALSGVVLGTPGVVLEAVRRAVEQDHGFTLCGPGSHASKALREVSILNQDALPLRRHVKAMLEDGETEVQHTLQVLTCSSNLSAEELVECTKKNKAQSPPTPFPLARRRLLLDETLCEEEGQEVLERLALLPGLRVLVASQTEHPEDDKCWSYLRQHFSQESLLRLSESMAEGLPPKLFSKLVTNHLKGLPQTLTSASPDRTSSAHAGEREHDHFSSSSSSSSSSSASFSSPAPRCPGSGRVAVSRHKLRQLLARCSPRSAARSLLSGRIPKFLCFPASCAASATFLQAALTSLPVLAPHLASPAIDSNLGLGQQCSTEEACSQPYSSSSSSSFFSGRVSGRCMLRPSELPKTLGPDEVPSGHTLDFGSCWQDFVRELSRQESQSPASNEAHPPGPAQRPDGHLGGQSSEGTAEDEDEDDHQKGAPVQSGLLAQRLFPLPLRALPPELQEATCLSGGSRRRGGASLSIGRETGCSCDAESVPCLDIDVCADLFRGFGLHVLDLDTSSRAPGPGAAQHRFALVTIHDLQIPFEGKDDRSFRRYMRPPHMEFYDQPTLKLMRDHYGLDHVLLVPERRLAKYPLQEASRAFLAERGVRIVEVSWVYPTLRESVLKETTADKQTFGPAEFIRLHLWNMTDYEAVLYLDHDMLLVGDVTPLLFCSYATGMYISTAGNTSPLNLGLHALKPDRAVFEAIEEVLTKTEYEPENGFTATPGWNTWGKVEWGDVERGSAHAGLQGFLYYFFYRADEVVRTALRKRGRKGAPAAQAPRCKWNYSKNFLIHRYMTEDHVSGQKLEGTKDKIFRCDFGPLGRPVIAHKVDEAMMNFLRQDPGR